MSWIIDGKPPRRSRFWLYLLSFALVGTMICGSRAMMLMEQDALWIGRTRVFPPWYHKTVRLRETHFPEATTWVDFMVGTSEEFGSYFHGRMQTSGRRVGSRIRSYQPPPGFPPGPGDNVRQAYIFIGGSDARGSGGTGHHCSGNPTQDFGFTVKQVLGFYLVTADPDYLLDTTGAIR